MAPGRRTKRPDPIIPLINGDEKRIAELDHWFIDRSE